MSNEVIPFWYKHMNKFGLIGVCTIIVLVGVFVMLPEYVEAKALDEYSVNKLINEEHECWELRFLNTIFDSPTWTYTIMGFESPAIIEQQLQEKKC